MKVLGVTPARGGSKGVPRKNIRTIAGKPLIAWTIEVAQKSKLLDEYVVSTEDEEIAEVARQHGAEVVDRPPELATDEATTLSVLQHALECIDADVVTLLQATSPIRDDGLIDTCIDKFLASGADSLTTGFVCTYKKHGTVHKRRQDIEGFFCDDGNVCVIWADLIRRGIRYGEKLGELVLDREQNIEIDDEFDFWLAEQILLKRQGLLGVGA